MWCRNKFVKKQNNTFFFYRSKKALFGRQFVRWKFWHQVRCDKIRKENNLWSYIRFRQISCSTRIPNSECIEICLLGRKMNVKLRDNLKFRRLLRRKGCSTYIWILNDKGVTVFYSYPLLIRKDTWNVLMGRRHAECHVSAPERRFVGDIYFNLV